MGAGVSHYSQHAASAALLQHITGPDHILATDPAWQKLLLFQLPPPQDSEDPQLLDPATEGHLKKFTFNNRRSGNLGSLVQVFLTRATDLLSSPNADNAMLSWQTLNALFVVRCVSKYLVENVSESIMRQHFYMCWETDVQEAPKTATLIDLSPELTNGNVSDASGTKSTSPAAEGTPAADASSQAVGETSVQNPRMSPAQDAHSQDGPLEMLLDALFGLIIDVPVTDNTYHLHLEAINTLLVLLSVHLFTPPQENVCNTMDSSHIYRTVFGGRYSLHAGLLIRALLRDVAAMKSPPPPVPTGSLVLGIASSIWSLVSGSRWRAEEHHPAASQACLLLLVLANHATPNNLYREALFTCQDVKQAGALGVDFASLHSALSRTVEAEHVTLLLYLLLHRNQPFRTHLLSRPDLHTLVVPIMRILYDATSSSSHHIYMSLIILLILSEDDNFNRSIHETILKDTSWYTERSIPEISLGGLLVLVIIRTIQFNMLRMRDKYLHTNCLAALANMSSEFRNLHPYVAQRLVSVFETLSRKHTRLAARALQPVPMATTTTVDMAAAEQAETAVEIEQAEEVLTEEMRQELLQDMGVLEEVLRMVLEIINSCLTAQLRTNVHLVYTLLHKRALFHRYRTHASFQDLIQNVEMVVGYFSARLQRAQEQKGALGASEVLAVVTRAADHWSTDRLRKFPDLKFRYVEEERPEEFFTPYVWSLVCSKGSVQWSSDRAQSLLADLAC